MCASGISVWTEKAAGGILPVSSAGSAPQHSDVGGETAQLFLSSISGLILGQNPLLLPADACAIKYLGTWSAMLLSGIKKIYHVLRSSSSSLIIES